MTKKRAPSPPKPAANSGPVVYCGPTIPGTARQYTVYRGGVPAALAAAAADNPALGRLILPLDRLPEARRCIHSKSGHIYRLFRLAQTKQASQKEG